MEINHLKELESLIQAKGKQAEGLSPAEIQQLEAQHNGGIQLPAVYREYLALVGKAAFQRPFALEQQKMQDRARKSLQKYGQELPGPFWVVMEKNNFEQFGFFFTGQVEEDPAFYNCFPAQAAKGQPLYTEFPLGKFSSLVGLLVKEMKATLKT